MRYAIRALLKDRGYTTIALLTLAFGIALNTVIFSLVNGVLLKPLAWRDAGQLVVINEVVPEAVQMSASLPVNSRHFFEWRDRSRSFAAMSILDARKFVLTGAGQPEQVSGVRTSANFLPLLGVQPEQGRGFLDEEDQKGHDRVALISDGLWARKFNRDPAAVGRSIVLDGVPRTVVGIVPPGFHFPLDGPFVKLPKQMDIFVPAAFERNAEEWLGDFNYTVIGRLQPGITVQQAVSEMDVIQASIAAHFPEKLHLRAAITPLQDEVAGPVRPGLLILFGAVGAVLLIVCVNLANLTLARVVGRRRDLAIRTALGAERSRLVRYILSETLCIAIAGGAAGVLLAWAGLQAVLRFAPVDLPRVEDVHLDMRVLLFATALSIFSGLLMGIFPALRAAAADPQESLRGTSHTATVSLRGLHTRDLLVSFESALSALLLIAAGLLIGSFVHLLNVDKGFDAGHLIAAEVDLPGNKYREAKDRDPYYEQLVAKLNAMPGVRSAALISHLPLEGPDWGDFIHKAGDTRPLFQQTSADYRFCTPAYFQTMGIPLTAGASFSAADRNRNPALISESAARAVWPGENPIGHEFWREDESEPPFEVVGVVHDVREGMAQQPGPTVYVPYWYRSRTVMDVVVRTSMDPRSLAPAIRAAAWSIDRDTAIGDVRAMQKVVSDSVGQRRFQMWLITGFAASALLLACIGIYGVVAWSVSRRRNEIGIRMALGAASADVQRMIVLQALRPVVAGLAVGVAAALALGRLMNSLLFGVSAHDPLTIATVVAVLSAVALLACYVPSRWAVHNDPLDALRYE